MSQKVRELRSLIYGKFDTEADMAKVLGWPRQRLSKITCGIKEPDVNELSALAQQLDKPIGYIAEIFLRYKSPNEQLEQKTSQSA